MTWRLSIEAGKSRASSLPMTHLLANRAKVGTKNGHVPITTVRKKKKLACHLFIDSRPLKARPSPGLGGMTRPHSLLPLDAVYI